MLSDFNSLLKGCHHDMLYNVAVVPSKKARHLNLQQRLRTREQRAELRQKKYRYLYQVRTAHGDVISQVRHSSHPKFVTLATPIYKIFTTLKYTFFHKCIMCVPQFQC
jgi:hypothetical protein